MCINYFVVVHIGQHHCAYRQYEGKIVKLAYKQHLYMNTSYSLCRMSLTGNRRVAVLSRHVRRRPTGAAAVRTNEDFSLFGLLQTVTTIDSRTGTHISPFFYALSVFWYDAVVASLQLSTYVATQETKQ